MSAVPVTTPKDPLPPWRFGVLLAILVFAQFPQVICGLETFAARDYGFFAYPLAHFQQECFWRGELPFWDPYNNCGTPFLAQWNTMPLYPLSPLYLFLPLTWSLSFFSLLHLWIAGLGMFYLARRWTGNSFAAAFAGATFAFNGFTINLLMWPSHIATFCWMPWVVLAVESAWREGGEKIPLAAGVGAVQMLAGGPETIALTWLVLLALWLQQFIAGETPRAGMLWRFPLMVALVFSLSAMQLLPFLDLVAHAQRGAGYTDLRWSMPASGWANFLVPMAFGKAGSAGIFFQHGQSWTSSYYLGIGTFWLAILSTLAVRLPRVRLLAALAIITFLCALGSNTPVYPLLRKLIPQLSSITYPVKFIMGVVFAAPLLAAFALAKIAPGGSSPTDIGDAARKRNPSLFLAVGASLLTAIIAIVIWTQYANSAMENARAALLSGISRAGFLLLTGAILLAMTRRSNSPAMRLAPYGLIVIAWLDVFTHEPTQNPTVPPSVYELNLARAQLRMDPQPELGGSRAMLSTPAVLDMFRLGLADAKTNLLAKRLGYCADVNLLDKVPTADGFFSLNPGEFDQLWNFVHDATNGNWSELQNFMGVSQYSSCTNFLAWTPQSNFFPLVTAGQKPVFLDDQNILYTFGRNACKATETVFLPPDEKPLVMVTDQADAKILSQHFGIKIVDFDIACSAPTLAVIAQTYFHNWQAEVDGRSVPLLRANVAFQSVQVPAGNHHIHLYYRDRAFEIGAAISVCMWINCLVAYLALRRRDLPPAPATANDYFY